MEPEYLWAAAGVACIIALLITLRIGVRTAERSGFGDETVVEPSERERSR